MENDKFTRKNTQDNFVTEKMDIIKNNLLGQYDEKGNYNIAPQIVNELINLKKIRKSSYNNSMYCNGNLLGYGEILFEICFDNSRDDDKNATSSLYVLEEVDKVNGYLQNIIKTKIAEFKSTVEDFLHDSYERFNVTDESDEGDDEGKEKKTLDDLTIDDSYILAKKAYMLLLSKLSEEKMLDAYGKYFTMRLSKLTKMDNEFSNAVLSAFNQRYELIQDVFLKEKNYKSLNELLDACIEEVSGTKDIYLNQENEFNMSMTEALAVFTENVNKVSDKAEQKAINMLDASDRQKLNQMNQALENNTTLDAQGTGVGSDDATVLAKEFEASEMHSMGASPVNPSFENPVLFDESSAESEEKEESESEEKESEQEQKEEQTPQIVDQQQQFATQETSTMQTPKSAENQPNIVEEIAKLEAQKRQADALRDSILKDSAQVSNQSIFANDSAQPHTADHDHDDASVAAYRDENAKYQNELRDTRLERLKTISEITSKTSNEGNVVSEDIAHDVSDNDASKTYPDKIGSALYNVTAHAKTVEVETDNKRTESQMPIYTGETLDNDTMSPVNNTETTTNGAKTPYAKDNVGGSVFDELQNLKAVREDLQESTAGLQDDRKSEEPTFGNYYGEKQTTSQKEPASENPMDTPKKESTYLAESLERARMSFERRAFDDNRKDVDKKVEEASLFKDLNYERSLGMHNDFVSDNPMEK